MFLWASSCCSASSTPRGLACYVQGVTQRLCVTSGPIQGAGKTVGIATTPILCPLGLPTSACASCHPLNRGSSCHQTGQEGPPPMGADVAAPNGARADASIQMKSNDVDSGSNSSMLVLLSVVVIALSLALLPMSAVTVIMAAMAGLWWLSSGNGTATVQMNSLPEAGSASNGRAAGVGATAADAAAGLQDENLGLDPPQFNTGRSVTAKRAALAAAAPPAPRIVPVAPTATAQASSTAVPAVAGDSSKPVNSTSSTSSNISNATGARVGATSASQHYPAVPAATASVSAQLPAQAAAQQQQAPPPQPAAAPESSASTTADAAAAPAALTGSAAILAKLRQQRTSTSINASSGRNSTRGSMSKRDSAKITVLYASQTGTGQEIARSIHAECAAKSLPSEVMSMNELGFDNLRADKTPIVVFVASSTGDGDPPDNSAAAFVAMKKSWPADRLAGVKFTVLGLGDSNYTRFMYVPRIIKNRMQDLGAVSFYPCAEADEVDGLEATVDPWVENILEPLQKTLQEVQQQSQDKQQGAAPAQAATPAAETAQASRPASAATAAAAAEAAAVAKAEATVPSASLWPEPSAMSMNSTAAPSAAAPPAAAAAAATTAAAPSAEVEASPRASLSPAASAPVELVDGLAPKGVDLKGVPPLAPCRITLSQAVSADMADAIREKEQQLPSRDQMSYRDPTGAYSAAAPFWATVTDAKLLTAESSDRTVIHVELALSDSGMRFAAGDAVGVLPANDPALVAALLARLGIDGDDVFAVQPASGETSGQALLNHIGWPCTFRHAFTTGTDLTSVPRKSLLRLLAEHCRDEDEQRTLLFFTSRAGREAYNQEIAAGQPSLLDLLRRFPSCKPPVHALLDALPPLAPRMYSLTNAPVDADTDGVPGAVGTKRVQFALSVVEFDTQYGTRRGVATTWLAKLCRPWLSGQVAPGTDPTALPEAWVPLFLRHAAFFKPPVNLATPMLMIGPGTGVAPFRGFLQQRLADMKAAKVNTPGRAWLYFGCRKPSEDYLYEQDWQDFLEAGALSKLRVAFSRTQAEKVYVQHLLKEDAAEVAKLIAGGAHIYVCGDGAAMAKDVHAALQAILKDKLGMSEAQAADELMAMTKQGRYVRDIWS